MRNVTATAGRVLFTFILALGLGAVAHADGDPPTLEVDLGVTVRLDFPEATVGTVLDSIGKAARLNFVFDEKVDLDALTSVELSGLPIGDALHFYLKANDLFYVVRGPDTVLIAPDTRQKRQEHMPRGVRTFTLTHADGRGVITILRSLLQTRQLVLDERLNTVTMNDTFAQIELAAEIIERIDRDKEDGAAIDIGNEEPLWVGSDYDTDLRSSGKPVPRLGVDMDRSVTIDPAHKTARELYESLGRATGIQFLFHRRVDLDRTVSAGISDRSAREALDLLNDQLSCFNVVWGSNTVFVAPDDRQWRLAEQHVAIQFFHLTHADTKSVITSLRALLQTRQLAEIPRLNAVVVKDNLDILKAAEDLIRGMDIAVREPARAPTMATSTK